jgi:SpoIID/LytB domain protein
MKRWLLLLALHAAAAAERPPVYLLRSDNTFRHVGWRARWEWQGARAALQHLGIPVTVVDEKALPTTEMGDSVLVLSNARNLEESTLAAVRKHLAGGGRLLASYQTSYRKADNTSWTPNGLALGAELGVKFLRWNGTRGETETIKAAPPYSLIGLARSQAMLVEAAPEATVLATWETPADAPSVVQLGNAMYLGEDLLAPENSHSRRVLGFTAGLLNRLDPGLRLGLPRSSPPLVEPQPPYTPLPGAAGEVPVKVGLGQLLPPGGSLQLSASKALRDAAGKSLGTKLRLEHKPDGLWLVQGSKRTAVGKQWTVAGVPYLSCWQEKSNGTLRWSAWRGSLQLASDDKGVSAVNVVPPDHYLAGVIPSEVPFTFPPETLKAMAVVARTYALSHMGRHKGEGFDVCSEVHCQVYRGLAQEHPNTSRAVLETGGELLMFNNQPADATFHACCGGHGVDVQDTWPKAGALKYLAGRWDQLPASPMPDLTQELEFRQWLDAKHPAYCSAAGRFRWEEQMPWAQLESKLKQSVPGLDTLTALEVTRRDPSGRVAEMRISGSANNVTVGGDAVRWLTSGGKIGAGGLQSSMFYLDVVGEAAARSVRIRGGGWGHGVGLCQEGAAGRARNGHNYRQILAHYYPGTQLTAPDLAPIPQPVKP